MLFKIHATFTENAGPALHKNIVQKISLSFSNFFYFRHFCYTFQKDIPLCSLGVLKLFDNCKTVFLFAQRNWALLVYYQQL